MCDACLREGLRHCKKRPQCHDESRTYHAWLLRPLVCLCASSSARLRNARVNDYNECRPPLLLARAVVGLLGNQKSVAHSPLSQPQRTPSTHSRSLTWHPLPHPIPGCRTCLAPRKTFSTLSRRACRSNRWPARTTRTCPPLLVEKDQARGGEDDNTDMLFKAVRAGKVHTMQYLLEERGLGEERRAWLNPIGNASARRLQGVALGSTPLLPVRVHPFFRSTDPKRWRHYPYK